MINDIIREISEKANELPEEFFENLSYYNENSDWLAAEVFPAWNGFDYTKPTSWILLCEEDIKKAELIDEEDESLGWVVNTQDGEAYFTLSPGMKFNKGMDLIIREVLDKM